MSEARDLAVALPSESERWHSWKAKGHADNLSFRRRLRMVVLDVVATVAFGGAIWFAFQF